MSSEEKKTKFQIKLEELVEEWEKDACFGSDVSAEIKNNPKVHNKYYTRLIKVRRQIIELNQELEELEFRKTLYYTGRGTVAEYKENPQNYTIPKGELPLWLKADNDLKRMKYQITCMTELKKVLEEIVEQINNRHWQLKTLLASERFKAGLN